MDNRGAAEYVKQVGVELIDPILTDAAYARIADLALIDLFVATV